MWRDFLFASRALTVLSAKGFRLWVGATELIGSEPRLLLQNSQTTRKLGKKQEGQRPSCVA